jgi:hypothetical protein
MLHITGGYFTVIPISPAVMKRKFFFFFFRSSVSCVPLTFFGNYVEMFLSNLRAEAHS